MTVSFLSHFLQLPSESPENNVSTSACLSTMAVLILRYVALWLLRDLHGADCRTSNKAFWSTKLLLQLSESWSSSTSPFPVWLPSQTGTQVSDCCYKVLPAINLQEDTGSSQKCMSLHPCVLEAHLASGNGGRDIWQGAIHSDLLRARAHVIKQD